MLIFGKLGQWLVRVANVLLTLPCEQTPQAYSLQLVAQESAHDQRPGPLILVLAAAAAESTFSQVPELELQPHEAAEGHR